MKLWQGILSGILIGFALGGVVVLVVSPPRGKAIDLPTVPTQSPMVVYVDGSVINPGLYNLPVGSRVSDAIQAAGGLASMADSTLINLAASVSDGQRLWVPAQVTPTPMGSETPNTRCSVPTPVPPTTDHPLNINTATEAQLDALPSIGSVKAAQIVAYRQQNGPFLAKEDIQKVAGITPSVYAKIQDLITISAQP